MFPSMLWGSGHAVHGDDDHEEHDRDLGGVQILGALDEGEPGNLTRVGGGDPDDGAHGGGFSGTVCADEAVDFARADVE